MITKNKKKIVRSSLHKPANVLTSPLSSSVINDFFAKRSLTFLNKTPDTHEHISEYIRWLPYLVALKRYFLFLHNTVRLETKFPKLEFISHQAIKPIFLQLRTFKFQFECFLVILFIILLQLEPLHLGTGKLAEKMKVIQTPPSYTLPDTDNIYLFSILSFILRATVFIYPCISDWISLGVL